MEAAFTENTENFEKLFLFEFLVDHVSVFNSRLNLDKQTLAVLGPMAVRFQFLHYPPIEVYQESFAVGTKPLMEETKSYFKSGKSCMFSLSSLNSQKVVNQSSFDVFITVYKYKMQRLAPGQKPEKPEEVFLGRTKLNLGDIFRELFQASKTSSKRLMQSKASNSKILDNSGNEVGRIMFLIRVSCFGFMVMTGFQLPEEERKSFIYKNIVYDSPGEQTDPDEQRTSVSESRKSEQKEKPCDKGKKDKGRGDEKEKKEKKKDKEKKKKRRSENAKKTEDSTKERQPLPCPFGYPPCACPCKIGQTQAYSRQTSFSGQVVPYAPGQVPTAQNIPSVASTQQVGPNRARDMDIDPGAIGIRGNQLVFKMPDKDTAPQVPAEGRFASSVYYKMEDEKQVGARNVIQILPKNPKDLVDPTKVDEKQDVLVLKLGKKRLAAGKKPKLELELRTPKMKEEKPPMEVKDTQYLDSDIPKPPKSARGSRAGKGGKGKKKKK